MARANKESAARLIRTARLKAFNEFNKQADSLSFDNEEADQEKFEDLVWDCSDKLVEIGKMTEDELLDYLDGGD